MFSPGNPTEELLPQKAVAKIGDDVVI